MKITTIIYRCFYDAFTQDKWLTSNSALTSEGLNASVIYGTLIAGKQLNIVSDNENGCVFYIGNIKDKIPNKDGLDFGLQIRNNMSANSGNGIEQIFFRDREWSSYI